MLNVEENLLKVKMLKNTYISWAMFKNNWYMQRVEMMVNAGMALNVMQQERIVLAAAI